MGTMSSELLLKKLYVELLDARKQLDAVKDNHNPEMAVVGAACRFPGNVDSPEAFWELLCSGRDPIGPIPASRWNHAAFFDAAPERKGKVYAQESGFIADVSGFDAGFFDISPREAAEMDPQQRILLELSWDVFQHAGRDLLAMKGAAVGVFVGMSTDDYAGLTVHGGDHDSIDAYNGLGTARSVAAGRVAYTWGFHGPVMQVDTACSSSLTALQLACRSIASGDCEQALVAGINLMLAPEMHIACSRLRALSPTGRCKVFDDSADGYVRSEGAGCVLIKPLTQALADGDRILGVIKSCAINHDGKSNGLTAPNGRAQVQLIQKALQRAQLDATQIGYVETHGTGTRLGDPIEVHALGDALQRKLQGLHNNSVAPLLLGSVKSNLGHMEAAAGMASLLKALLIQQHGEIPANLHFTTPNRQIQWDKLDVKVVAQSQPWPLSKNANLIGINAFGLSGTNVHVIVGPAPERAPMQAPSPLQDAHIMTLSAKNADALTAQLQHCRAQLNKLDAEHLADWCSAQTLHSTHFPLRKALVAGTHDEMKLALDMALHAAPVSARAEQVCFVFTGQGAQYAGMGRELAAQVPGFRRHMEQLSPLFESIMGFSLEALWWGEYSPQLNQTQLTQPALFAFEYCLAQTLIDWNVKPDLCLGHSVGEYVAACVAGMLSLEDALRCIALRARCMADCEAPGTMVAVLAPAQTVLAAIAACEVNRSRSGVTDHVAIAAYNSPGSTVMSGDRAAVEKVMAHLTGQDIRCVALDVSHAFHSPLMQPAANALLAQLPTLQVQQGTVPVVSNVSAGLLRPAALTPAYLAQHIVEPVRFADSIRFAAEQGANVFIEIGPKSTLTQMLAQILPAASVQAFAAVAQAKKPLHSLWQCLGKAYELGINPHWQNVLCIDSLQHVTRIPYPFARQPLWTQSGKRVQNVSAAPASVVHQLDWLPVDCGADVNAAASKAGNWLVLNANDRCLPWLADGLSAAGARISQVMVAGLEPDYLQVALASALEEQPYRGIILQIDPAATLDASGYENVLCQIDLCRQLLNQADARAEHDGNAEVAKVWLVSQSLDHASQMLNGPLHGFVRAASLEKRRCWGGHLELRDDDSNSHACVIAALLGGQQDLLRVEAGVLKQPRLHATPAGVVAPLQFNGDDALLVAGGAGGIGLQLCNWCVERGLRKLLIVGRRELHALGDSAAALQQLEARGVRLWYRAVDVADAAALGTTVTEFETAVGALTGFVHAAGVASMVKLEQLDGAQLHATLNSKFWGGWNLHQLSLTRTTKMFALFSSISSVWGALQLAHYAAANACLDALAEVRLNQGLPVHCLQWGPWKEAGMARDQVAHDMSRMGVRGFDNAAARNGFFAVLDQAAGIRTLVDADWQALARTFAANPRAKLFADLALTTENPAVAASANRHTEIAKPEFSTLEPAALEATVGEIVRTVLAQQLQLERASIDPQTPFNELGLDSLLAVDIGKILEARVGLSLPATLLFDAPNTEALTAALCLRLQDAAKNSAKTACSKSAVAIKDLPAKKATAKPAQRCLLTGLIDLVRKLDDSELDRMLSV